MTWSLDDVETRFLEYMEANGHQLIEGHSVMSPTDDVLFTTAGMHPLTPYLHGQPHPKGRRLCDVQRCVRTTDIEEVGDNRHLTIFEMVGNWSLGDYFKETAIPLSMGLLTGVLGIDPEKLYVTTFAGLPEPGLIPDDEAVALWSQCFSDLGIDPAGHINPLTDNWWSNGPVGLCGPDTEMFVYVGDETTAAVRRHLRLRGDLEQRVHDLRARRRRHPDGARPAQHRHRHGRRAGRALPQRRAPPCGRPRRW